MDKIPFTAYDFFAYLSSGFLFLTSLDVVFEAKVITMRDSEFTFILSAVLLILSYITGHLLGHFSSMIYEKL